MAVYQLRRIKVNIECPRCKSLIRVQGCIDTNNFEGHIRCWGCYELWNIVLSNDVLVSIEAEQTLIPAVDNRKGRFN